KSQYPQASGARLEVFLAGPLDVLPLDEDDAVDAGAARAVLERAGTPIGAYDVLIAGQARRRGLTVVTANVSEFERVTSLSWEDWAH
ncbi:MAG: type II toxin-antitoxin system VapC family toxin, partial [Chloroflexota bacterium]|nr:type II toxin-antitoxin system VapC family toxin [Chloroflexota bacterium]